MNSGLLNWDGWVFDWISGLIMVFDVLTFEAWWCCLWVSQGQSWRTLWPHCSPVLQSNLRSKSSAMQWRSMLNNSPQLDSRKRRWNTKTKKWILHARYDFSRIIRVRFCCNTTFLFYLILAKMITLPHLFETTKVLMIYLQSLPVSRVLLWLLYFLRNLLWLLYFLRKHSFQPNLWSRMQLISYY